jgi:hypothetical protein
MHLLLSFNMYSTRYHKLSGIHFKFGLIRVLKFSEQPEFWYYEELHVNTVILVSRIINII